LFREREESSNQRDLPMRALGYCCCCPLLREREQENKGTQELNKVGRDDFEA